MGPIASKLSRAVVPTIQYFMTGRSLMSRPDYAALQQPVATGL
jgi:hypothetical protein